MQINNILDFDDEASAKAYNFTITAIKEFYDTIESDQFTAAGGDTIYAYLTKVMELVSFKEQLKRYIYMKHQEQGNPILKWIMVPSCWQPSRKMTVWQVSQSRN